MLSIGISDLRANMNIVLKRVQYGEVIVVTSRGSEIARLVPPDFARLTARKELAVLQETAYVGDVFSPLDEAWEADER